jgi:hypothetical protein
MKLELWIWFALTPTVGFAADVPPREVTFNKDVLPILQKHCQGCHCPGQIAPISFLTYQAARPWAKAMKAAVATRKMPPRFADSQVGHFANAPTLKQTDVDLIAKWADNGAPEGDPTDAPTGVKWPSRDGRFNRTCLSKAPERRRRVIRKPTCSNGPRSQSPGPFLKDKWVSSIEVRPGNRSLTHHIRVFFKPHSADVVYHFPRAGRQTTR